MAAGNAVVLFVLSRPVLRTCNKGGVLPVTFPPRNHRPYPNCRDRYARRRFPGSRRSTSRAKRGQGGLGAAPLVGTAMATHRATVAGYRDSFGSSLVCYSTERELVQYYEYVDGNQGNWPRRVNGQRCTGRDAFVEGPERARLTPHDSPHAMDQRYYPAPDARVYRPRAEGRLVRARGEVD